MFVVKCRFISDAFRFGRGWVLSAAGLLISFTVNADTASSMLPVMPGNGPVVRWVSGPDKVDLAGVAKFKIPEGYRFADVQDARLLLARMKNPIPPALAGLLAPESGRWWIVIEYTNVGYVRDLASIGLDSDKILKQAQEKLRVQNEERAAQGLPGVISLAWETTPVYDSARHSLEWALRAETQSSKAVNHAVQLLSRRGVVTATAVQPIQSLTEEIPLRTIVAGIAFNPGEQYSDYQEGDAIADIGLAELVGLEESMGQSANVNLRVIIWVAAGLVVLGITGCLVVVRKRLREIKLAEATSGGFGYNTNGSLIYGLVAARRNGHVAGRRVNGSARAGRRMFDYARFYSDMMWQVSSHPHAVDGSPASVQRIVNTPVASPKPSAESTDSKNVDDAILRANLELIASQTNLIAEQKRLLQEQSRIIEEKSKLIREKNELLERQTELFERDILSG